MPVSRHEGDVVLIEKRALIALPPMTCLTRRVSRTSTFADSFVTPKALLHLSDAWFTHDLQSALCSAAFENAECPAREPLHHACSSPLCMQFYCLYL